MLLYKKERDQYAEEVKGDVSPSTVYGAEHLLRLFGMSNCPLNELSCVFGLVFDHFVLFDMVNYVCSFFCIIKLFLFPARCLFISFSPLLV